MIGNPPTAIVNILYGGLTPVATATVALPLVIYQGSQVALGQGTVAIMRWWKDRVDEQKQASSESVAVAKSSGEI